LVLEASFLSSSAIPWLVDFKIAFSRFTIATVIAARYSFEDLNQFLH